MLLLLLSIGACKPKTPSQYIQPDDIEDVLVDYFMARAIAQREGDRGYKQALYEEAVFSKHGITRAEFDSSMVYYYTRADRFNPIFQRVADRLEEQALIMGATEGEIGKYASFNATGDTANIWAERSTMCLVPKPPFNRWEFSFEGDSNFHCGDSFLMQFMSEFVYQGGNKSAIVYLAFDYPDTTITKSLRFSVSGLSQLHIPEYKDQVKSIRGYFYAFDSHEPTTQLQLLFLNNVQFIRFHNPKYEEEQQQADSLSQDNPAQPDGADSLGRRIEGWGGDSLVRPVRRTAPDGVAAGVPHPEP